MKYLKLFENFDDDVTPEEVYAKLERDCKPFLDILRPLCRREEMKYYDFEEEHQLHMFLGKECPVLYRGSTNSWETYDIQSVDVRKDRRSKDTNQKISDEIDDVLEQAYGIRPRKEGVFTSPKRRTAEHYGFPFMFFPIGDFDYIWSPAIRDLFDDLRNSVNQMYSWYLWEIDPSYRRTTIDSEARGMFEHVYGENQKLIDIRTKKEVTEEDVDKFRKEFEEEMDELMAKDKQKFMEELPRKYNFNKNFEQAMLSSNEVMFVCDEYYLVKTGQPSSNFEVELLKLIYNLDK